MKSIRICMNIFQLDKLFFESMVPEWALAMIMSIHQMTRNDAIEHIRRQEIFLSHNASFKDLNWSNFGLQLWDSNVITLNHNTHISLFQYKCYIFKNKNGFYFHWECFQCILELEGHRTIWMDAFNAIPRHGQLTANHWHVCNYNGHHSLV